MTALELIAATRKADPVRAAACQFAINANGSAVAYRSGSEPWYPAAELGFTGWQVPLVAALPGQCCRCTLNGYIPAADEQWQEVAP